MIREMNEELLAAIFSKTGIKIIQALHTNQRIGLSPQSLSIKTGIPTSTIYRKLEVLVGWSNIGFNKVGTLYAPLHLYYIKSHNFTIHINKKGVEVKVC